MSQFKSITNKITRGNHELVLS